MYNIILKKYLINTTSKGSSMVLIKSLCGMDHLVLLYTVLSSIGQPGYTKNEVGRMVGGSSFGDKIHSALRWLGQKAHQLAPMAKTNMMAMSGNPYGQAGAAALGALGYGSHKALENRTT